MRLFVNGELASTQPVDLDEGSNRITFTFTPKDPGFLRFRIVVEAARDTFNQNDRADANTIVKGEPRMLVVKGDEDVAAQLVAALEAERQQVDTVIPEGLPADLAGLADYDSIVLVDVPRLRLTDQAARRAPGLRPRPRPGPRDGRRPAQLRRGRLHGHGRSRRRCRSTWASATARSSPTSRSSSSSTSRARWTPATATRSRAGWAAARPGSRGVKKTDIGKEAILRAASALTAQDELGVVAFDESAHWVVKTAPLGGIADLQGSVNAITPNGQTNIFAGLDQAVDSLKDATATRRHIILLTDGWSSSGQYDGIIKDMKAAGITLSTVGAGGGSNPFLEQLARNGGGRFYNAANPSSIPDIFLKETQQVSGQQIVEEAFFPILTSQSPILRGIDGGFPRLLGYNGTTAKSAAQTVLVTARDDPLLAQWQYGLGRSVAWTSDSTGRWARNWIDWDGFSLFFSQMVGWTFPGEESGGIEASFVDRGGRTYLRVDSVNEDGSGRDFYRTSVALVAPDLTTTTVDLSQVAPGVYETPVADLESGAYAVRVTQTKPGRGSAGSDAGPRRPHPGRIPPAGCERAAPGRDPQRDGWPRRGDAGGGVGARPPDDEPVHGPVAVAAGARAPPVAARHRAAPRVARSSRARRWPPLGLGSCSRAPGRRAHEPGGGPVRGPRACRLCRSPLRDPARGRRTRGRRDRGRDGWSRATRAQPRRGRRRTRRPQPLQPPARRHHGPRPRRRPRRSTRPATLPHRHPRPRRRPRSRRPRRTTRWPASGRRSAGRAE